MPYVNLRGRKLALILTLSAALGLLPLAILAVEWGRIAKEIVYVELAREVVVPWSITLYSLVGLSLPLALTPIAVVMWMNLRYTDALNRQLSTFFKGTADGVRAGMPLTRALEVTARAVGPPLEKEILDAVSMTSLGVSFEEALGRLTRRVPEPSLVRATSLLVVAHRSGGRVADVLDAAAQMYGVLNSYEDERRANMSPYVWVSYIALAVFLLTATIITTVFVEPLASVSMPGLITPPPPALFKTIFYISAYLQAIAGGLVSGKISRGTVKAGVIHVVVMLTIVVAYYAVQELYLSPLLTPKL